MPKLFACVCNRTERTPPPKLYVNKGVNRLFSCCVHGFKWNQASVQMGLNLRVVGSPMAAHTRAEIAALAGQDAPAVQPCRALGPGSRGAGDLITLKSGRKCPLLATRVHQSNYRVAKLILCLGPSELPLPISQAFT